MSRIKNEGVKTSRRIRECYNCGKSIKVAEKYVFREERYDRRIFSFYWHHSKECAPQYLVQDE